MMERLYAYPKLARRGLGNMLFTWAQAVGYCHKTGAQMLAPVWVRIARIGPWLRHEKYKRYYGGQMTNDGYVSGVKKMLILFFKKTRVRIFTEMDGYFLPFIDSWDVVRDELHRIVDKRIIRDVEADAKEGEFIGVHVRRGDFVQAGWVTSDEWFVKAVKVALAYDREGIHKYIRVFSDGYPEELSFLQRAFPNERIIVMPKAPAIQDILLMSRSRILVCSPASTFSMWAVFLGQMPSVWMKDRIVPQLYIENDSAKKYWC